MNSEDDTLSVQISDGLDCGGNVVSLSEYGEIISGYTYHIDIGWNTSFATVFISDPNATEWQKHWSRSATLNDYIGVNASVWWTDPIDSDYNINLGNGTFSNITIESSDFSLYYNDDDSTSSRSVFGQLQDDLGPLLWVIVVLTLFVSMICVNITMYSVWQCCRPKVCITVRITRHSLPFHHFEHETSGR